MRRPHPEDLARCQDRLGYVFRNPELLIGALTHGSAKSPASPSNERLEFLGDAILGMVVSAHLYRDYPELCEGRMTKVKSQTVSRKSLARVARSLDLADVLIVGRMFDDPDSISSAVLADATEAIIAAIYLDGGMEPARDFVLDHLAELVQRAADAPGQSDYKSLLGQWAQRVHGGANPEYRLDSQSGPDHDLTFVVTVMIGDRELAAASGSSKKAAEREAARIALARLDDDRDDPAS